MEFWDHRTSDGVAIRVGDTVQIHYQVALGDIGDADGPWIEDSWSRDALLDVVVGRGTLLAGVDEAILGMRVAAERRVVVPPAAGFGARSMGERVPADTTLTFNIYVVAMTARTTDQRKR